MPNSISNTLRSSASQLNPVSEISKGDPVEKTRNYDKAAKLLGQSADELCKKDPPKLKEMDEELREILQSATGAELENKLRAYMSDNYLATISFATITEGNVSEIRTISLPEGKKETGFILNTFTGTSKDDCAFVQKKYTDPRDIKDLAALLSPPNKQVAKPDEPVAEPLSSPPAKKKTRFELPATPTVPADAPANSRTSVMVVTDPH